jgi:hypothetical protein
LLLLTLVGMAAYFYQTGWWRTEIPLKEWAVFSPPDGRCQVLMPGTPEPGEAAVHGEGVVSARRFRVVHRKPGPFFLPDRGTVFLLTYSDRKAQVSSQLSFEAICRPEIDYLLEASEGVILAQTDMVLAGHPGREVEFKPAGGGKILVRLYLVRGREHDRLYLLFVAGTHVRPGQGDAARFLDSFQIRSEKSEVRRKKSNGRNRSPALALKGRNMTAQGNARPQWIFTP